MASDPRRDLAGVLHDVSNALTVLLGWVGEARSPEATPEAVEYALKIIEQRARIARDLSRQAIGSPRIEHDKDVLGVVDEVVAALRVEAQKASCTLMRDGAAGARVSGELDLSQVVTNVVMNAISHSPEGGVVAVRVSVLPETVVIDVADEGPGVPPERREKVFRGDSLRPGGTGVGLRHSRALARAAGGDVEALEVDPELGACFRIHWPRADAVPRPPVSAARIADLEGMRVLVIEDDDAVTQLLEAGLGARGATVFVAATMWELDAALAASAATEQTPGGRLDAILVDLSPVSSDPAGAFARIRAACPAAALVVITGNADALPEAVSAEQVWLVRKPFEVREIVGVLTTIRQTPSRP
ncbi:MAG: hybrid sensor histidine kinase/response regulator [Myxococcales bacterium]|nr:hybrid sensor histidine kinase/response regulator [Myxococcales bacterium]